MEYNIKPKYISIKGARSHNLKNIDVNIPKNAITVITGLSGSGKSSLAFDTIYTEGQRRYVESLSAYTRQFLGTFDKPDVDSIEGLSPAISIEQKTTSKNPRSTVGTITEIYDYLRLLFARVGIPYSPVTGLPIERQSVSNMVDRILKFKEGTKIYLEAPIVRGKKGEFKKELLDIRKKGFQRLNVDGNLYDINEIPHLEKNIKHNISVVVDRLIIKEEISTRLVQSLETALELTDGICNIHNLDTQEDIILSNKFACPVSGFSIEEIEPRLFSFNSPFGACEKCNGLGTLNVFSEHLLIPNPMKPFIDAIEPWSSKNSASGYYKTLLKALAKKYKVSETTPYVSLTEEFKNILLYGTGTESLKFEVEVSNHKTSINKPFDGLINILNKKHLETESTWAREHLSNYLLEETCPKCEGQRLNKKALQVKIDNKNIYQITELSINNCYNWTLQLNDKLSEKQKLISEKILKEIIERLSFLNNVGIGYLNLSRKAGTLSGGESQRIRLASQIGSGLTGVLYILDEPSIGLHQKDNDKLLETLQHLKNLDNTVIVVEHDEDTIKMADYIIDMGPGAGIHGGNIIAEGTIEQIESNHESITGLYLTGQKKIDIPKIRRKGNGEKITIHEASGNNLKNITVNIPLGTLVCVTGVSGSGKSTLINETLFKAVSQHIYSSKDAPASHKKITGLNNIDKIINIDQSPIGKMPTSNPATYTKVFDAIRAIFVELPEAKSRGYKIGRFSFNVKGGRCEHCKGDGVIKIEMHFLADVYIKCEECKGKRYNRETLEIKWNGKSIADILDMTVEEANKFFASIPQIHSKLQALCDVGLDYITLGQSATTFSGGEAQRIKLAKELSKKSTSKTLYILDEPSTGLHFEDINKLVKIIQSLVDKGNTAVVIEHNLDIIKVADYIIDIGPDGGDNGGQLVAQGTPEKVAQCKESYTGKYLKKYLL